MVQFLNFIKISSSNKTLTLQSKSAEADEVDIRIPQKDTVLGSSSNNLSVSSPGRSPSFFKKQTPTTPILTEREIDKVFDTIKIIDDPDEKSQSSSKPPKEKKCLVAFGEANKFVNINVRGKVEDAIQVCKQTFNIDESTSARLDVYDPKVEVYVVAETMNQIKSCKEKLSSKPIKLRLELNKPLVSFEEQMGWIEMKLLGSGAFGEVKMVYDKIHSKTMAVKKIHVSKGQKEYKEKIEKEIQVMQALEHPNIVKCFGYHENGEFFYIMMELMLGGSLKSVLKRIGKGLTEDLIQDYLKQIISALVYIHEEIPTHVYHRDLKCDNFLLAGGLIKLADFGEAKVIQKGQTLSQTRNSVVGTLTFCSPEMLKGDPTYKRSHAPDIWSLGMCILEMIFGYNIWEREFRKSILSSTGHSENSDSDPEALYSEYRLTDFILKNLDTLPSKVIPELQVSEELKDLLTNCLKVNPADRPKASELLQHKFFYLSIPRGTLKQEILEQFHFFTDECEKLQQKALPTYCSTVFRQTSQTKQEEYSEDYFD